ncbi:MAG TPA: TetR family transcriptional regulator C-terminal domain-containing protein, partial [Beutenbergiaceae bacterium]|nr:TetR family transcriptional regulator C-terminal domain-containing protein [Beutenbergiaceae bacterium]
QISQRAEAVLASLSDVPGDPSALAATIGQRLMDSVHANPQWQMLFFEFCLRAMRNEDVRLRFVEHRRVMRKQVAATTETLRERLGITTMSAESLTVLVMSLSNGLAIEEMVDPGAVPRGLISDVLTHLQT